MAYSDAIMSDIVVVVDDTVSDFDALAEQLKQIGVTIEEIDHDNGVIEGTVIATQVTTIQKINGVKYVRSVFTYEADFPVGDPRNQDKDDRPDEEIPR
jgi:hypothetical protein